MTPLPLFPRAPGALPSNPFNQSPVDVPALKKDCLNYISFEGKAIKSSRLFLGNEYDHQCQQLARHFQKDNEFHRSIRFDLQVAGRLVADQSSDKKFFPQTMAGTGPFPQPFTRSAHLDLFDSYEEAYHQLMLDLVWMQVTSSQLVLEDEIRQVFVSGGFAGNEVYMKLLATALGSTRVLFSSTISRATALGAAMVIHRAWNDEKLTPGNMQQTVYPPVSGLDLSGYRLVS